MCPLECLEVSNEDLGGDDTLDVENEGVVLDTCQVSAGEEGEEECDQRTSPEGGQGGREDVEEGRRRHGGWWWCGCCRLAVL